jgi:hypothetical protein
MELQLQRSYAASGTNGILTSNDGFICYTIELPWRNNKRGRSCIPEGCYRLVQRYSEKFQWHLHLIDVPGRDLILIHPANHALLELKGCIAPVMEHTAPGEGTHSKRAFYLLMQQVQIAFLELEPVLLTIKVNNHENHFQKSEG